jgi:hypothetical protein
MYWDSETSWRTGFMKYPTISLNDLGRQHEMWEFFSCSRIWHIVTRVLDRDCEKQCTTFICKCQDLLTFLLNCGIKLLIDKASYFRESENSASPQGKCKNSKGTAPFRSITKTEGVSPRERVLAKTFRLHSFAYYVNVEGKRIIKKLFKIIKFKILCIRFNSDGDTKLSRSLEIL